MNGCLYRTETPEEIGSYTRDLYRLYVEPATVEAFTEQVPALVSADLLADVDAAEGEIVVDDADIEPLVDDLAKERSKAQGYQNRTTRWMSDIGSAYQQGYESFEPEAYDGESELLDAMEEQHQEQDDRTMLGVTGGMFGGPLTMLGGAAAGEPVTGAVVGGLMMPAGLYTGIRAWAKTQGWLDAAHDKRAQEYVSFLEEEHGDTMIEARGTLDEQYHSPLTDATYDSQWDRDMADIEVMLDRLEELLED